MDILIEGVGGIGGVVAGELLRAGFNPTLITHNPRIAEAINRDGLRVMTPNDDFTVSGNAYADLDALPEGVCFDAVYLIMKANGVVEAARRTLPYLKPDAYVVAFQNGLVEDALAKVVGQDRVLALSVAFGANMEAPGVYRRTTEGKMIVGEMNGRISERVTALRDVLSHALPTELCDDVLAVLWGKLAWNCVVSGLCAVSGDILGELVAREGGRRLFLLMYRECLDVAHALNIKPADTVIDNTAFYLPVDADADTYAAKEKLVADLAIPYYDVKPSSLQSLQRGRPTETEFLNGYLIEKAASVGVNVPLNAAVADMIAAIERGEREIAPENLTELERYW